MFHLARVNLAVTSYAHVVDPLDVAELRLNITNVGTQQVWHARIVPATPKAWSHNLFPIAFLDTSTNLVIDFEIIFARQKPVGVSAQAKLFAQLYGIHVIQTSPTEAQVSMGHGVGDCVVECAQGLTKYPRGQCVDCTTTSGYTIRVCC